LKKSVHLSRLLAVLAAFATLMLAVALPASAATLDRIKEAGRIRFGYLPDARPFTYQGEGGRVEGYTAALCEQIATHVQAQLAVPQLKVEWVPVKFENRLQEVQQGNIDVLCAPTAVTKSRQETVAFSIPTFPGGVRAMMRLDASRALRQALAEKPDSTTTAKPSNAATKALLKTTFGVMSGTTTETWLNERRQSLQVDAKVVTVPDYKAGVQALRDKKIDVFFGDRALILGTLHETGAPDLFIFDRLFTQEPFSLALARNDDDFRLLVDRTLREMFTSKEIRELYQKCCGEPDEMTRAFAKGVVEQQ
jgi:polar amino acid transport system substrate-binding protein